MYVSPRRAAAIRLVALLVRAEPRNQVVLALNAFGIISASVWCGGSGEEGSNVGATQHRRIATRLPAAPALYFWTLQEICRRQSDISE
jgi:hypothetical protein